MKLPEDVVCHCWTDSTVALAWIQSDPHKWKPFVSNRVTEIQTLVSPSQWYHCPGKENPADLVTRGIMADELLKSQLWLQGPNFLTESDRPGYGSRVINGESSEDRQSIGNMISTEQVRKSDVSDHMLISVALEEGNTTVSVHPSNAPNSKEVLDITRWSSFTRAMRVIGWVQRFLYNSKVSKEQRRHSDLSLNELIDAKLRLLKYVQKCDFQKELLLLQGDQPVSKSSSIHKLTPIIGEDGLLRVQGRLPFSGLPYQIRHPIIIPNGHLGLLLARHVHVSMKHAGVNTMLVEIRNQYWMVGARRTCKRVKRECVACQRLDAPAGTHTMAPLPEMRVKQASPFSVIGLDHGGPLYCCDFAGKKFYVLLFTCAVIRAVHLELVGSLSCESTEWPYAGLYIGEACHRS